MTGTTSWPWSTRRWTRCAAPTSIGILGLTPGEIVIGGGIASVKDMLHRAHLYRWGNCTCHLARQS